MRLKKTKHIRNNRTCPTCGGRGAVAHKGQKWVIETRLQDGTEYIEFETREDVIKYLEKYYDPGHYNYTIPNHYNYTIYDKNGVIYEYS